MNSKIENLLKKAAETHSPPEETSSVTNASRFFPALAEAENAFQNLKEKLFLIEFWNKASELSSFAHYDENGKEQPQTPLAVGSMIKISLPGSGKDDWVKIIEIYDAPGEFVVVLQPSFDPTADEKDKHHSTSHFFTDTSTNNFCLQRIDKKLSFYVVGLHERTNTEDTENVLETIRNAATANAGYFLGIQKFQWKTFCENFINGDETNE